MRISPLSKRVLMFLRQKTFSTALNIQNLLAHQNVQATHQLLKRMCRDGLVQAADINVISGRPIKLYGITEKGIAYAWELTETVTSSMVFQPSKVSPLMLQHELDMQVLHIDAENCGWVNWQNAKHLGKRLAGAKYPDALVHSPSGEVCCIEVEREIKSTSRMRQILASHLAMRKAGHWQKIIYLCPSLDLARRLQRKFELLEYVTWRGARVRLSKPHFEPFIFADYKFFNSKTRGHTL